MSPARRRRRREWKERDGLTDVARVAFFVICSLNLSSSILLGGKRETPGWDARAQHAFFLYHIQHFSDSFYISSSSSVSFSLCVLGFGLRRGSFAFSCRRRRRLPRDLSPTFHNFFFSWIRFQPSPFFFFFFFLNIFMYLYTLDRTLDTLAHCLRALSNSFGASRLSVKTFFFFFFFSFLGLCGRDTKSSEPTDRQHTMSFD